MTATLTSTTRNTSTNYTLQELANAKQRISSLDVFAKGVGAELLGTDHGTVELTYDANGLLTNVAKKSGTYVIENTQLNYTNGVLQSVVTTTGSLSITETLVYDTNGNLITITRGW